MILSLEGFERCSACSHSLYGSAVTCIVWMWLDVLTTHCGSFLCVRSCTHADSFVSLLLLPLIKVSASICSLFSLTVRSLNGAVITYPLRLTITDFTCMKEQWEEVDVNELKLCHFSVFWGQLWCCGMAANFGPESHGSSPPYSHVMVYVPSKLCIYAIAHGSHILCAKENLCCELSTRLSPIL